MIAHRIYFETINIYRTVKIQSTAEVLSGHRIISKMSVRFTVKTRVSVNV